MLREDRAGAELHVARAGGAILLQHLRAGDVRRHQIGRELDAAEVEVERLAEAGDEQRLRQSGHAGDEAMAAGEEGGDDVLHDLRPARR